MLWAAECDLRAWPQIQRASSRTFVFQRSLQTLSFFAAQEKSSNCQKTFK